ncbi:MULTISPECIES: DNA topoisomerase IV subunit A [Kordiimonas]|jgi:topoisomerase-4 subunit A|uniref:DNA topoisomerase 4 subunit A n=1 Tax=Kordiimonas lacus TaxID=637679 RepID=A0A1G7C856_9PROT|nr:MULTISPECIES: DNA topoisomerase IV subunit A [Kordiimonas]SDE35497.1 DNA topoisomerase IV subunit A [Kordiimonas lacus]
MTTNPEFSENIIEAPFADALSERYLAYALSTIMSRSLPDVRDGLKPVHRRLLYAMRLLKLDPKTGYKKCARVVGDVIGKYHPHGDQAVYDAMVRLAQDFSVRFPLVDGQGNFGNIDGDNAAAMRYTEARLTEVAAILMEGLEEDAVDFRETYDGEDEEPVVFPGAFPNLLANGSSGIAVGMATNIPPHNVGELVDGLQLLIEARRNPAREVTVSDLLDRIPGPDFPTGGQVVENRETILHAYETGRGSLRVRARWEKEELPRGLYNIVITEIPYQVQKSKLIEKIAELIGDKKLPILTDVRDESAEDLRIVLEPKNRTVDEKVLMESLFRFTELETRFSFNMNVIALDQRPRVQSLKEILDSFLDHQIDVLLRRNRFRLEKIERRLEILSGYLIAYLNLDEVIRIIREEDDAKASLMSTFKLTDNQAEAILNMRLRALRKLEEMEIRTEHAKLEDEKSKILALLDSEELQWIAVGDKLSDIKERFGPETVLGKRRTRFGDAPVAEVVPLEAMIEKEPITVVCSKRGWIRALKGHTKPEEELKYKEGDEERFRFHAQTTDKIFLFATNGKIFTLGADKLPGGRGNGEPVRLMVDMEANDEIVSILPYQPGGKLFVASSIGKGFIVEADNAVAMKKGGKQILNVKGDVVGTHCIPVDGDSVAVIGENRKLLVFDIEEVPTLARGQGVALQRYKDGGMADVMIFHKEEGLTWPMGGNSDRWRTETELAPWTGRRGNAGRLPPMGFPRNNKFR